MVTSRKIHVQTKGNGDMIDLTPQIAGEIGNSGIKDGIATVFVMGSTAGITTIEYEPRLVADYRDMWDRVAPRNIPYRHSETWGDDNGFSHVRASVQGASLSIPFVTGQMTLGTWQQIVMVDFDTRPRSRDIVIQIMGE
ncbi:MAG: secondary thiamine-phosphate synthase enzyme YjbQ [Dehalococcoidales bacterium]|nr:secondary thiamine-phosphate synthase enzyme YjbQ [Dehalococcoidales bacterium]